MRAGRFRLHDREDVRIKRFDSGDRIAMANPDPTIGDRVDAVAARSGNRRLSKSKYVADDSGFGNRFNVTDSSSIRAAALISDALRANMPMVSSVGASGIAPLVDTAP